LALAFNGIGSILDLRHEIEHLEDAVDGGHRGAQYLGQFTQPVDRHVETAQVGVEQDHLAEGELLVEDKETGGEHDQNGCHPGQESHRGGVDGAPAGTD